MGPQRPPQSAFPPTWPWMQTVTSISRIKETRPFATRHCASTVAGGAITGPIAAEGVVANTAGIVPLAIAVDANGVLYFADLRSESVFSVDPVTNQLHQIVHAAFGLNSIRFDYAAISLWGSYRGPLTMDRRRVGCCALTRSPAADIHRRRRQSGRSRPWRSRHRITAHLPLRRAGQCARQPAHLRSGQQPRA